jgi:hypothetical protein
MTSPSTGFDLLKTLDGLIDGWCERRALKPLGYLLRKYPGPLFHTDQQFELLDALKDVKGLCYHELTPDERRLVTKAHDFLDERLNTPSDDWLPKHIFSKKG